MGREVGERRGGRHRGTEARRPVGEDARPGTEQPAEAAGPELGLGGGHQLGAEAALELRVDQRLGPRRAQPPPQLEQLEVAADELLELGVGAVVPARQVHQTLSACGVTPRRWRTPIMPRWISSFTAPSLLPMISPIWASLRSSPSLRVSAVR